MYISDMSGTISYADAVRNGGSVSSDDSLQVVPSIVDNIDDALDDMSDSGNGSEWNSASGSNCEDARTISEMMGRMNINWRSFRTPMSVSI